jgi:tetratricopeptide (TPR) repeat protein
MNNLANCYRGVGKMDQALTLHEECLKIIRVKQGADHPNTLAAMANLGVGYLEAQKPDLGLPLLREAATGIEKQRFRHENAGPIIKKLIDCHETLNQFDQAEMWRRKWLAVVKERDGADSPAYAKELEVLGLNLFQQKKWSDAETVWRDCLAVCQKVQPDGWWTFDSMFMVGVSMLAQKNKAAEAKQLLLAGYEGMKQRENEIPAQDRGRLINALDLLVQVYEAEGDKEKAAEWRQRLEAQKKQQPGNKGP